MRHCATTSLILRIQVVSAHVRFTRHLLVKMEGHMLAQPVLTFL